MIGLMSELQEAAGRSYDSVPFAVGEYFELSKENFNSKLFNVETVFENDEHCDYFYHLYCRFCEKSCLKTIWGKHSDKLPEEKSIKNLMLKWDELDLSWMNIDMLGCLLPNDESHTVVVNAKGFFLRPETHYNQVHEVSTVSKFYATGWGYFI